MISDTMFHIYFHANLSLHANATIWPIASIITNLLRIESDSDRYDVLCTFPLCLPSDL